MNSDDKTRIQVGNRFVPGARLNDTYQLDELIASGGMGQVFRGHNIETEEPVAIKTILSELADDDTIFALFKKEGLILSRLNHPTIVRYYAFSRDPRIGRPYLVMEYVEGESLAERLRSGPLSLDDTYQLFARVAEGLSLAHKAGVVHRDLSPDNIIIQHGSVADPKVIDFGIAHAASASTTLIGGSFAGKFSFVSPEQLGLAGSQVTNRSDIYSLGLVMAAALRGKPLNMGTMPAEVIERRRNVPDLSEVDAGIRPLIEQMLQPEAVNRPESMGYIADWLAQAGGLSMKTSRLDTEPTAPWMPAAGGARFVQHVTPILPGRPTTPPRQPASTVTPSLPGSAPRRRSRLPLVASLIGTAGALVVAAYLAGWIRFGEQPVERTAVTENTQLEPKPTPIPQLPPVDSMSGSKNPSQDAAAAAGDNGSSAGTGPASSSEPAPISPPTPIESVETTVEEPANSGTDPAGTGAQAALTEEDSSAEPVAPAPSPTAPPPVVQEPAATLEPESAEPPPASEAGPAPARERPASAQGEDPATPVDTSRTVSPAEQQPPDEQAINKTAPDDAAGAGAAPIPESSPTALEAQPETPEAIHPTPPVPQAGSSETADNEAAPDGPPDVALDTLESPSPDLAAPPPEGRPTAEATSPAVPEITAPPPVPKESPVEALVEEIPPEKPQDLALNSPAGALPEPVPPPPESTPAVDPEDCYFAAIKAQSDDAMSIKGVGLSQEPFERIKSALADSGSGSARMESNLITAEQCPTTAFLKAIHDTTFDNPDLSFTSPGTRHGDKVAGVLDNVGSRLLTVFMVDGKGRVFDMKADTIVTNSPPLFDLKLDADRVDFVAPGLIVAVASDQEIDLGPARTAAGLPALAEELVARGDVTGIDFGFFSYGTVLETVAQ